MVGFAGTNMAPTPTLGPIQTARKLTPEEKQERLAVGGDKVHLF
jgi:hypothetical protein